MIFSKKLSGQSLVELLIAISFAVLILPVLFTSFAASYDNKAQRDNRAQASDLINEEYEKLRAIRDAAWSNISTNGTFHTQASSNTWILSSGSTLINGKTVSINISDSLRDSSGNIATSGTVDPSTKRITIEAAWTAPYSSSISKVFYLTRFRGNSTFIDTTEEDFNQGSGSGTMISNSSGGEIILGAGVGGNWCAPDLVIDAVDLPKNGVANAVSAVEGNVVAGTGDNSSGVSFASVDITNENPPTGAVQATFDGYKTNDVFTDGNYAYLATDNNGKEVVILDLNNIVGGKYQEIGYFNIPGNTDGVSVFVPTDNPNVGFVTSASNRLYSFNLSAKTGSRAELANIALASRGTSVVASQGYAYVSISGSTQEMQIVSYNAAGTTLVVTGYADVNGQGATDVAINNLATRAYITTGADSSRREFFVVNTEQKTGSRTIIGSYDTNGMSPKGVTIVTSNKAIAVGSGAEEYQVIDITNETSPSRCGGIEVNSGVNGVASVLEADGDAYSYVITGDSGSELKIIEGGSGGTYSQDGVYTSAITDLGQDLMVNRISATTSVPNSTTAQFQIAIAKAVSNSCIGASYDYVGPDGTSSSYFGSSGGIVPFSQDSVGFENPGRCIRYKSFLTTQDIFASPVVFDVLVNYSP